MEDSAAGFLRDGELAFQYLTIDEADGIDVVARLRETQADIRGRAFLLNLDFLMVRLGARWEAKRPFVLEHLKANFADRFQEPNWCAPIGDNSWLAVTLTAGPRAGALKCAEIWHASVQFFIGDSPDMSLPLFEAIVKDATHLKLRAVDLNTYFDRGENFGTGNAVRPHAAPGEVDDPDQRRMAVGTMTPMRRPAVAHAPLVIAGRRLQVACALEGVFELRQMRVIGHRFRPAVIDLTAGVNLDDRALDAMEWTDKEDIDAANVEQGIRLLAYHTPEQRKSLMIVPVAFSTLASARGRSKVLGPASTAAGAMDLKILVEIHGLKGVPPHRIQEIVHLIRPFCRIVVGRAAAEPRAIQILRHCGLAGVCIEYDGVMRDDASLLEYLGALRSAAKLASGACMTRELDNFHQMAVARLAGISHASIKTVSLLGR